ncbi:splicing factor, Prp19-binding domain-containing protein [Elsinoe ampelina]|uniref:Splicing factor, Prp19-binding domain-containing protein n=1 Tax=Elsinoe ampelina TaxID=302913 RepID=A0A6A6GJF6_9PEZI|nr:splicing factor, Prp19-binding domain-containing protein [Elsinoe ampelina]
MPPKRFTANPLAAPRYRAGKALPTAGDVSDSSSDSSDSESETAAPAPKRPPPPKAASFPKITTDIAGREAQAAAARAKEAEARQRREQNEDEEGFVTASDSDSGAGSGSQDGDDDDEEESDSADDYSSASSTRRRFTAPTFVKKGQRQPTHTHQPQEDNPDESERRRLAKADELLQQQIALAARERALASKEWDADDAGLHLSDVDDTDNLDPAAEHAAWVLRELKRIKRERLAIETTEKEREEVERRRALTSAERDAEDREFIDKQKSEREGRGQMGFMQKYFHRGAFFQDDGDEEVLAAKRRDLAGRRFEDDALNRELLPEYMQIRDMTKLGKKGRTRYRDMKAEDTGRFGGDERGGRGRGEAGGRYGGPGGSGANNVVVGERRGRDGEGDGREGKRVRLER